MVTENLSPLRETRRRLCSNI